MPDPMHQPPPPAQPVPVFGVVPVSMAEVGAVIVVVVVSAVVVLVMWAVRIPVMLRGGHSTTVCSHLHDSEGEEV